MPRGIFLGVLLILGLAGPAAGQEATLTGRVVDSTSNAPLGGASVRLMGTETGTATGPEGRYRLDELSAGQHRVEASYLGYRSVRKTVTLAAGETAQLDFALAPTNVEIGEVTVEDERAQEEARDLGVAELSTKTVKELPAVLEPDVFRALQLLPGVKSASDFSSGLYIRGGSPDQTLILLDRTTVYSPSHFFGFFSLFNPDAIGDVRLYKGGYPAEYGGRLGSVVDLSNKTGSRSETHGTVSLGMLASRASVNGPHPYGSWMLAVRRSTLEPLLAQLNNLDIEGIPDAFHFYDVNGKLDVRLTQSDRLKLGFYTGSDVLQLGFGERSAQIDLTYGNRILSAQWEHIFSDRVFGRFALTGSGYASVPTLDLAGTPIDQRVEIQDGAVEGDLAYTLSAQHTLEAGFQTGYLSSRYTSEFNQSTDTRLRHASFYTDLYVQETYRPSERWQVRGGLRGGYFAAGAHWHLAPRLSAEFRPLGNLRLQVGYGRYFQYPSLASLGGFSGFEYWLTAGEDVPPAWGDQFVAGIKTRLTTGLSLDVEGYYRTMRDLFELDPFLADPSGLSYREILQFGSGYAYGAELFLEKTTGPVNGFLSYTWSRTRRRFPNLTERGYYPPKYDRTHDLNLVINYGFARTWRATAVFAYATGQAYTQPTSQYKLINDPFQSSPRDVLVTPLNNRRLPPYHRLDLGVSKRGSFFGLADYEVQLQAINVYSRRNVWFYNYNFTNDNRIERETIPQIPIPLPNLSFTLTF